MRSNQIRETNSGFLISSEAYDSEVPGSGSEFKAPKP